MATDSPDLKIIEQQLDEFLHGIHALMLATVNAEGLPEASYTPYVMHEGCYYIFISQLATHTKNLNQSGVASVLFLEADEDAQAYTRKRLSCQCNAKVIDRENALFETVLLKMEDKFGQLIKTLRGLGDFQLLELNPVKGNFVAGFGQAFEIDFPVGGNIRHRKPN